jgi:hypothetical protein
MHEQSESEQRNGRWKNLYGRKTDKAGQPLPLRYGFEREDYETVEEAVAAARRRSELERRGIRPLQRLLEEH